jgi:WD40 repeat protein
LNQRRWCWANIAEIPSGIIGLVPVTLMLGLAQPAAWAQVSRLDSRWDYNGDRILGPIGQDVYVWDAETGREIWRLAGHRDYIYAVRLSPDGRFAMTSSWNAPYDFIPQQTDTSTRLWDLQTGEEIHRFENLVAGDFSPDSRRIVTFELQDPARSGSSDVAVWDAASGDRLLTIDESMSPDLFAIPFGQIDASGTTITSRLRFTRNGDAILYHRSETTAIWDAATGREIGALKSNSIRGAVRFDSSAHLLAAIGNNGRVEVWDLAAGGQTRKIDVEPAYDWKWMHDGSRAVGADWQNHRVLIWDAEAEEMTIGADCVCGIPSVVVSPDATRFAVQWGGGSSGGESFAAEMGLFDARTGEEISVLSLENSSGEPTKALIGFAPDGETFLVSGDLFTVYNSQTGEALVSYDLFAGRKP